VTRRAGRRRSAARDVDPSRPARGTGGDTSAPPVEAALRWEGPVSHNPAMPRLLLVNEAAMGVGHLGHGRVTDVMLEVMPKRGWTVEVLPLEELGPLGRLTTRGWPVLRRWDADVSQVRWHVAYGWAVRRRILERLTAAPEVAVVLVHTHSVAFVLPRRTDVPVVLSIDVGTRALRRYELWRRWTRATSVSQWLTDRLEKRAIERHQATLAWTRWTLEGLPTQENTHVWHPGILPSKAPAGPGDRRRLLFVGGRFEAKGGYFLLDVLAPLLRAGRVQLDIVTQDDVVTDLPHVTVRRLSPGPELDDLFAQAGLLLLASVGEGVPWVILEALRVGTPVLASDVGANREVIGSECGWVLPLGDASTWRSAVEEYLDLDEADWRDLSDRCRSRVVEHFDAEVNADRLDAFLRALVTGRPTGL
jgi:glycosyltransferase involved in cell wall biosynthesis